MITEAYKKFRGSIRYFSENDPIWFFEYLLWTHDPRPEALQHLGLSEPMLPFLLYDYQKEAIKQIHEHIETGRDLLIEKSRDMGVSWLVMGMALFYWSKEQSGNDILIGSRKYDLVDKKGALDTLLQKFRYNLYLIAKFLPGLILPAVYNEKNFDNVGFISNPLYGNYIRGEANNANFGTGGRYKFIILDEFSKWEETDASAWTSCTDSTPCRIVVSTPWGMGRKFAKLRYSGDIDVLTFHWSDHPTKGAGKFIDVQKSGKYQWRSFWYDREVSRPGRVDDEAVKQELDIDYISSGYPFFNNNIVQSYIKKLEESPPVKTYQEYERIISDDGTRGIKLYEVPRGRIWTHAAPVDGIENRYLISCDVAEGLEHGDNSVFYVYDRVEQKDVCGFAGKIDATTLGYLLAEIGAMYNNAYIGVENNSMGLAVIQVLKEIYPYLYHQQRFEAIIDIETEKVGWNTNRATRSILVNAVKDALNDGKHGITEVEALYECLTFVNINGKPQADYGEKDDRVMAQGIKWMVHDWLPSPQAEKEVEKDYGRPLFGINLEIKNDPRVFW
jgi:hypothetical protein